jgi:hypothetical protein
MGASTRVPAREASRRAPTEVLVRGSMVEVSMKRRGVGSAGREGAVIMVP